MLTAGLHNLDCMIALKEYPDNYFDLAIADPPYGAGFTEGGGCQGWFSKYHQDPENVGGGTTEELKTPENLGGGYRKRPLRFHGGSKSGKDPWNRYLKDTTLHVRSEEEIRELSEPAEHGRRGTQKNYCVGRCARKRLFQRAIPRLTEPDNMGRKLFRVTADTLFPGMAQALNKRKVFYGNV